MTDYTARFKPEDLFVKEAVAIYSSAITDLSEPLIKYHAVESLLQNYAFRDDLEQIEIIYFIFKNWFLVPILEKALAQAKNIFGEDTVLALELFSDPEDEKESTELFIVIRSDLNLDESLRKFDKLLADWFNTVQHKTKGLLNITIESNDEF
ncbi:hypothetical protein ES705_48466 [subsurface metagenome]